MKIRDEYERIESATDDLMQRLVESRWTAGIVAAVLLAALIVWLAL